MRWRGELAAALGRFVGLELVAAEADAARAAGVDLDLYHLADDPRHGFVYRALLREPGLVILEHWNLHALVHAETVGRGDGEAYRREARRAHGPAGAFIAEQELRGQGGVLTTLLTLNERVLEASLGVVALTETVAAQARRRLRERPLLSLPLGSGDPGEAARALVALARELAPRRREASRVLASARSEEATPLGRALGEILPLARELGLSELPPQTRERLAELLR